jgi:alkaline phosphatase D
MKRREFIALLTAGAASAATINFSGAAARAQQTLPNPAQWLHAGPMLGRSEITATEIWLQTKKSCYAAVRFWKQGKPETARLSEIIKTSEDGDFIARFPIERLEFGTIYDYEIYLDGLRVRLPYDASFQSQKMWRWRTKEDEEIPPFRIAIGSCAYINDADYDRPGNPYGGGYEIFGAIAEQKPDAMLWLGDNVYYREADWLSETAMRYRYAHDRALPEMRKLLATTHHYAIWDDHDFGPNDSDFAFRMRDKSLKVFKDYWANAQYGTAETPGVFGSFEWNDVEFFLLDNRYYRSANRLPDSPKKQMFGDAQLTWLENALASSRAPFKIIAAGNQMLNPMTFFEAFGTYPAEQKRMFDFIREAKIPGVMFLSGDRHHSELIRRVEPGLYPLYDFTSSPLTSGPANPVREENNPARVPGTLVKQQRNFGLIEASGTARNRKLTLRTMDAAGKELWRHEISRSELTFPKTT